VSERGDNERMIPLQEMEANEEKGKQGGKEGIDGRRKKPSITGYGDKSTKR